MRTDLPSPPATLAFEVSRTPPPAQALARACRALWLATLSLMTAYLHESGRAQRLQLARRIARNFETLERESEVFAPRCREAFARLARRWARTAEQLASASASGGRLPRRVRQPL